MKEKGKYRIIGALAGAANGLFGAGGGLFLVPLFTSWTKLPQRKALASSVAVILPLSLISAGVYLFQGGLDFSLAWPYMAGGAVGGICSGFLFQKISPRLLRKIFALLLLYAGIKGVFGF